MNKKVISFFCTTKRKLHSNFFLVLSLVAHWYTLPSFPRTFCRAFDIFVCRLLKKLQIRPQQPTGGERIWDDMRRMKKHPKIFKKFLVKLFLELLLQQNFRSIEITHENYDEKSKLIGSVREFSTFHQASQMTLPSSCARKRRKISLWKHVRGFLFPSFSHLTRSLLPPTLLSVYIRFYLTVVFLYPCTSLLSGEKKRAFILVIVKVVLQQKGLFPAVGVCIVNERSNKKRCITTKLLRFHDFIPRCYENNVFYLQRGNMDPLDLRS